MASRSDGSAIKALFPPSKGDPPTSSKKKAKSPSSKNDPPPDESITLQSPPKNTPPPEKDRKSLSPHKNAPPPDQNKENSSLLNSISPPSKDEKEKKPKISGKPHLKFRSTSWTYSRGQRPYPAKCRSMALCSIWRK